MPCRFKHCLRESRPIREVDIIERRFYNGCGEIAYPTPYGYPYANGVPFPYPASCQAYSPQSYRVIEPGEECCERRECECREERRCENESCEFKHTFKAVTLGSEELFAKSSVPFHFNAFGNKKFIQHFPDDTNFVIKEKGLYEVSYKLNFIPPQSGTFSFVLRQNGTPITETFEIVAAENGKSTAISFFDILKFEENMVVDLHFSDGLTPFITVVDPFIIFRKLD